MRNRDYSRDICGKRGSLCVGGREGKKGLEEKLVCRVSWAQA